MREPEVYRADTFAALPTKGVKDLDIGIVGNNIYQYLLTEGWVQTKSGGSQLMKLEGPPANVEPIIITCNGADDVFTDPTAPLQAELFQITGFSTGKKRCYITWNVQAAGAATDIPYAAMALATINTGPDKAVAVSRLTLADNGVGDHTIGTFNAQAISEQNSAFWNLYGTDSEISDVMVGFIPPVGTAAVPVRLAIYVW